MLLEYDKALSECDDYSEKSAIIAKNTFQHMVELMPECDFKAFVLQNMEEILNERE